MALFVGVLVSLFACTTTHQPKKTVKSRFLKNNINQAELNNSVNYKPYHYRCNNKETGGISHLTTYFPLSRESRMKDNFGFYFQLDNGKSVPFDHSYTLTLNARGTKFEVVYRSYDPIQGSYVDLIARSQSSIYYKNQQGKQVPWLICKGGWFFSKIIFYFQQNEKLELGFQFLYPINLSSFCIKFHAYIKGLSKILWI